MRGTLHSTLILGHNLEAAEALLLLEITMDSYVDMFTLTPEVKKMSISDITPICYRPIPSVEIKCGPPRNISHSSLQALRRQLFPASSQR